MEPQLSLFTRLMSTFCLAIFFLFSSPSQNLSAQEKTRKDGQPTSDQTSRTQITHIKNGGNDDRLVVNTDLISFNVTVSDLYGRSVSGLSKDAFKILDENAPQDITYFSDNDAPVSVSIIFDLSASMGGKIDRSKEALAHFLETSHVDDEYFLIGFNSRSDLLLDKTRDIQKVLDKLTFVKTKGNTALYDAVYLGVQEVLRGGHQKRALLIISDGQDNSSRFTANDVLRLLKESDVIIYSIGIEGSADGEFGIRGGNILSGISSVTGGKAFFPVNASEMDDVFGQIAVELRHQYAIGYRPTNFAANGRWHRIKIGVEPIRGMPRLFVHTKDGYFAQPKTP